MGVRKTDNESSDKLSFYSLPIPKPSLPSPLSPTHDNLPSTPRDFQSLWLSIGSAGQVYCAVCGRWLPAATSAAFAQEGAAQPRFTRPLLCADHLHTLL